MFKKPFRTIDKVFIHCSASDEASHDNVHTIRSWHVNGNKWADIGYHYLITKDGSVHEGRSTQFRPAAQKGHNTGTIAIGNDHAGTEYKNKIVEFLNCFEGEPESIGCDS